MRTLFDIFMVWPMPALWILLPGVILLRRRFGRVLILVGGVLLFVGTTPFASNILLGILGRAAPVFNADASTTEEFDAIIVPLAGAYEDPAGRWWPMPDSVDRAVRGQQLQEETGLRLIILGGAPLPGQSEPEAIALQRVITLAPETVVESTARNTFETARAVSELLQTLEIGGRSPRVVIVTDGSHVARLAASLRRFGIDVAAVPLGRTEDTRIARNFWLDLVPSARGAGRVRRAVHEFTGIGLYLITGRVRLQDL